MSRNTGVLYSLPCTIDHPIPYLRIGSCFVVVVVCLFVCFGFVFNFLSREESEIMGKYRGFLIKQLHQTFGYNGVS